MSHLPIALDVRGRPCVVIGGGALALGKVQSLLDAGAAVSVIASDVGGDLRRLADEGAVSLLRRDYRPGDLAGAWVAIDTSGDAAINQAAASEARDRGVLINVLDVPELCDFIAPAVVRRGQLTVAVSTSGESPVIASLLRSRIAALIGEDWGPFVALVGGVRRRLRQGGMAGSQLIRVQRRLVQSTVRRRVGAGDDGGAASEARAIEEAAGSRSPGRVALVGAGPGDPGLLTLAGQELLATADVVVHDALIDQRVLAHSRPGARLIPAGKRAGEMSPSQEEINDLLIALAREGHAVVRLKGGDPFTFGRGGEELAALRGARIETVVVPGVSSALAAPAAAGIPVTLRGTSSSVAVVTGHDASGDASERLARLAASVDTLIVLMPLATLAAVTDALRGTVGPGRPAALVASATLPDQRVVVGGVGDIARRADDAGVVSPAVLVVGDVVGAVEAAGEVVAGAVAGGTG